jgi:hypothetical protein
MSTQVTAPLNSFTLSTNNKTVIFLTNSILQLSVSTTMEFESRFRECSLVCVLI